MNKERFNIEDVSYEQLRNYMLLKVGEQLSILPNWNGKIEHEKEIDVLCKWMLDGKKSSLILQGNVGSGKTILATALCNTLKVRNLCPALSQMGRLVKYRLANGGLPDEVFEERLFFLDDVGTEPREIRDFGNPDSVFNEVIFARYAGNHDDKKQFPTILTTNLTFEQMRTDYGERVFSRLTEMFDRLVVGGKDLRINAL